MAGWESVQRIVGKEQNARIRSIYLEGWEEIRR